MLELIDVSLPTVGIMVILYDLVFIDSVPLDFEGSRIDISPPPMLNGTVKGGRAE
jgi:hypothetical protein